MRKGIILNENLVPFSYPTALFVGFISGQVFFSWYTYPGRTALSFRPYGIHLKVSFRASALTACFIDGFFRNPSDIDQTVCTVSPLSSIYSQCVNGKFCLRQVEIVASFSVPFDAIEGIYPLSYAVHPWWGLTLDDLILSVDTGRSGSSKLY